MQPRRQHLIDTAYRLFNEHGFHATGIDWILKESGVSKATLYKYFRSKEVLILAVLEQRHVQILSFVKNSMDTAQEGRDPVLAIFDALDVWFNSKDFFGCNFINASAEYSQQGDPIRMLAVEHKDAIRQLILCSLAVADESKKKKIAEEISLLVDGAIVHAHTSKDRNAALIAKRVASTLLASSG